MAGSDAANAEPGRLSRHLANQCLALICQGQCSTTVAGTPTRSSAHVIGVERGTSIGVDGTKVHTIEHVLAAVAVRGIDNLRIELDSSEPPVGDGSSLPFWNALEEAGIRELNAPRIRYRVEEPIFYQDGDVEIVLLPSDRLRVSLSIDFDHPLVGHQFDSFEITPETFAREIAPARTFGFLRDIEKLQTMGLAGGGHGHGGKCGRGGGGSAELPLLSLIVIPAFTGMTGQVLCSVP